MVKYNRENVAYIDVRNQEFTIQERTTQNNEIAEDALEETGVSEYTIEEAAVYEDRSGESNHEETTEDTSDRHTWAYDETMALISSVEARYDELYHPKTKKGFWNRISEELLSQKLQVSLLLYIF